MPNVVAKTAAASGTLQDHAPVGVARAPALIPATMGRIAQLLQCEGFLSYAVVNAVPTMMWARCAGPLPDLAQVPRRFIQSGPTTVHAIPDAETNSDVQRFLGKTLGGTVRFVARFTITQDEGSAFLLYVFGKTARSSIDLPFLQKIQRLNGQLATLIQLSLKAFRGSGKIRAAQVEDLLQTVAQCDDPAMLLGEGLRVVSLNPAMHKLLSLRKNGAAPGKLDALAPLFTPTFPMMCDRTFLSRMSPPPFHIEVPQRKGPARSVLLDIQPVHDVTRNARYLVVSAKAAAADAPGFAEAAPPNDMAAFEQMPMLDFLFETLLVKPMMRSRNGVSYVTVRAWRKQMQTYQLAAFKALKRGNLKLFADRIAEELAQHVQNLLGGSAFRYVVPVPCGHSGKADCLSAAIAKKLARRMDIKLVKAFEPTLVKGSSHPKRNTTRPRMKLTVALDGPALLVDDIATSGAHIEEAALLLRPFCGAVLPLAWLSGSATQGAKAKPTARKTTPRKAAAKPAKRK